MNKDKEQILEKVLLPLFLQEDKKGILLLFFLYLCLFFGLVCFETQGISVTPAGLELLCRQTDLELIEVLLTLLTECWD